MPPYNKTQTDWISKEKRELFCKAVNSMLMTNKDVKVIDALSLSQEIVDTAFINYPDKEEGKVEGKSEDIELPTKG